MEQKCRFYKEGKPNSCKNGDKCPYSHDTSEHRKKSEEEDKHHHKKGDHHHEKHAHTYKEKDAKHAPSASEESEQGEKHAKYGNQDAELKQKAIYLSNMMDSLMKKCQSCDHPDHLVLTTCGCQKMCKGCAKKEPKCAFCKQKIDNKLFITAFS